MIRPLRRRHRYLVGLMFLTLVVAALLARAYPAPRAEMTTLPVQARER
jgi:hypothetical protein